jgi:hypothetical protein
VLVREVSWDEVVRAGTVIFGPSFAERAEAGGWRRELRAAYRRRVLETHPDRAAALGRGEAELAREFRAVSEAYELLARLRAGPAPAPRAPPPPAARRADRARPPPRPTERAPERPPQRPPPRPTERAPERRAAAWSRTATAPSSASRATAPRSAPPPARAAGPLPARRLRLAELLYYAGRVGFRDLAGALAWQRAQRPSLGRLAVAQGFLTAAAVVELLSRRRAEGAAREPFGRFAVRRGYLTELQRLALLGRQQRAQRPIGRYFVERGLLTEAELEAARLLLFRHNAGQPR